MIPDLPPGVSPGKGLRPPGQARGKVMIPDLPPGCPLGRAFGPRGAAAGYRCRSSSTAAPSSTAVNGFWMNET
ncbi:MAG: hypothetical protein QOI27_2627 [Gaiellaceae bacterium]|nr:hypothetical protein [Gaiellaceae bacterium]